MTGALIALRAGALAVDLQPALGGSIVRFDHCHGGGTQPLLRGNPAATNVLDAACFPLVPFANRIRDGRFTCGNRTIMLAPNMAGDASPLHGQGWLAAWRLAEVSDASASLIFDHPAGKWPWAYRAQQDITLDDHGLSLRLSCRNLSADPMPCALGYHPYYPCDDATVLDTHVDSAWTIDAAVLPVANVAATGCYDLTERAICGQDLDNGFDGWGGTATIHWPGQPVMLRLSSPDAGRFQVYSPASGGLFVAEPVQNANCALNAPQSDWPALGITMLGPDAEMALHVRFDVLPA